MWAFWTVTFSQHLMLTNDGIGPRILKYCSVAIYEPLFHLFSLSLSIPAIPKEWRIHKITPIFKSGDETSCIHVYYYRPISLLCCISKVLEKYKSCIDFVIKSISRHQFGFLPQRSAPQQLLTMLVSVVEAIDDNAQIDCIYLDFKEAFDSVPHNELLLKLRKFGITGSGFKHISL